MIIRAKYALLAPGEARRDVRLEVDGSRIVNISSGYSPTAMRPDIDLGMAVITPGLVNPHAHLELEFCENGIQLDGSFLDWLQGIRDLKAQRGNKATSYPEATLRQLARTGCTTVVDHHTTELDWTAIDSHGLRHVPLREFFQFNNHDPDIEAMRRQARLGYAAHSPYTTSIEVAKACRALADEAMLPLSVHISEIAAELQFILDGDCDEIRELLKRAGAWDESWRGVGVSPVQYFADCGILTRATYAVHMNYLRPGDMDVLSALRPTVVFCPATHAYFGHSRHPIDTYLKAGVPVAIGTDSYASNSIISPLREAALVRQGYPEVSARDVFAGITLNGLGPLGWDSRLGAIEAGRLADFACYRLDGDPGEGLRGEDLFTALFDAVITVGESSYTAVAGAPIWDAVTSLVEA